MAPIPLFRVFFLTPTTLVSASPPLVLRFTRRGTHPATGDDIVETDTGQQYLIASKVITTDLALRMSHEPNTLVIDVALNTHIPLAAVGRVSRFEVDMDTFFRLNSGWARPEPPATF